jgi:hypothetical protein
MPTFRNAVQSFSNATTLTVTKASGIVDGDFMLMSFITASAVTVSSVPSGWTLVGSVTDAPRDQKLFLYWKTAASEPSTWDWVTSSSADKLAVNIAYSSVNTTTPLNTQSGAVGTSSTTQTTPSVTPSVDGCTIVAIYGCDINESKYPATPDASPVATERIEGQNSGGWTHVYVQDYDQATAAAITLDATFSNAATTWVNWAVAVAPAAGGGAPSPSLRTVQSNLRW